MKAAVCTRYGPPEVLRVQEVKKPVPRYDEVLVRIRATTVTSSDCYVRSAVSFAPLAIRILMRLVLGVARPRKLILGMVLAGEIEQIGGGVTRFRTGDRVYAFTKFNFGCYAQYTCIPQTGTMSPAPSNLTFEEVAAIPYGGLLALHFLRRGNACSGQRVLIYGASGAVGSSAVQLARHFGAEVTGVCGTTNLELVESLGAVEVFDYLRNGVFGDDKIYDLVVDAVGKRKTSALKKVCEKAVAPGGRYISVDEGTPRFSAVDLALLKELVESGRLKPVIDRCYPLEQIVEAHRYVEQQHKKGNVIIAVG